VGSQHATVVQALARQRSLARWRSCVAGFVLIALLWPTAGMLPWMLYQLWQFVAAGLYPRERQYIARYLPLSIVLLVSGMLFLYWIVLPLMMTFFLEFNFGQPDLIRPSRIDATASTQPAFTIPEYQGDPEHPVESQLWFDRSQFRLKFFIDGKPNAIPVLSGGLATPLITLAKYIDMVVAMLLSFGLAFQMPLVVLALVRIGIVEVDQLKTMRRYIYFAIAVLAAAITPGDVITATILLTIPLVMLYELGIWLAKVQKHT